MKPSRLDELLSQQSRPSSDPAQGARQSALDRVRASVRAEAERAAPARGASWRVRALLVAIVPLGVLMGVGGGGALVGAVRAELLGERWPSLLLLSVAAIFGSIAAIAPRRAWMRGAAVALGVGAAGALLMLRPAHEVPSAFPQWVCSATHLAAAILPAVLALHALRYLAHRWTRAVTLGIAVGTTGALLGELVCEQGMAHALVFHLGAWAAVIALTLVLSSKLRRRSYAP